MTQIVKDTRIGWWEIYCPSDTTTGWGYAHHREYVYGKKPVIPTGWLGHEVRKVEKSEIVEMQEKWEEWAEQARVALIEGELTQIRMKGD